MREERRFRQNINLSLVIGSFVQGTLIWDRTPPHQFLVICFPTLIFDESYPNNSPGFLHLTNVLDKVSALSFTG